MQTYLVIDFDSTFVQVEALDELARIALRGVAERDTRIAQIEALTVAGMEGKIGFGESLLRRLELFPVTQTHIDELVELLRRRVTDSFVRNAGFLRENAERVYVVSGGFREYIVPVVAEFGIRPDHVLANTFVRGDAGAVVGCDRDNPLAQGEGKVKALRQLALDGRVVMVGDGYSDFQAREQGTADVFVAFVENVNRSAVTSRADVVASDFDEVMKSFLSLKPTGV